jgi:hypothetical protein
MTTPRVRPVDRRSPARRRLAHGRGPALTAACIAALFGLPACFHDDGGPPREGDGITEHTNWTGVNSTPPAPTETDAQRSNPEGNEPISP